MKKHAANAFLVWSTRILSLSVMLALVALSAAYLYGYFDLTFIDRIDLPKNEAATAPPADTEPPTTDTPTTESSPPDDAITPPSSAADVSASLFTAADAAAAGYGAFEGGIYTPGTTVLARLSLPELGTKYSYSVYSARVTVTTEYERGCIVTEEALKESKRPAVMLKNGYLIRDIDGALSLLSADGTVLIEAYNENEFRLTDLRDENGTPLFAEVTVKTVEEPVPIMKKDSYTGRLVETGEYEEGVTRTREVEVYTYYTLSAGGERIPSTYTDENPHTQSDVGLSFDMPLDYGKSDSNIVRYKQGARWGYKNAETGEVIVTPRYTVAYNFRDGFAIAFDNATMYFLNEYGTVIYSEKYERPEKFMTYNEYTLPDTNGIESLGTYYFSHGLTRLRLRKNLKTYQLYSYIKESDTSILVDVHGKQFDIPYGYSLLAYSDGVLLLQNNETKLYGCMNYKGAWILMPEYKNVLPSLSGMIVVTETSGKMGLFDTEGNEILPCLYDYISAPSADMVAVYDETLPTKWEVYKVMTQ